MAAGCGVRPAGSKPTLRRTKVLCEHVRLDMEVLAAGSCELRKCGERDERVRVRVREREREGGRDALTCTTGVVRARYALALPPASLLGTWWSMLCAVTYEPQTHVRCACTVYRVSPRGESGESQGRAQKKH